MRYSPAKKSLGQNFLMHRQTSERIVAAAGVLSTDTVLEIGPGHGALTKELLKKAAKVIAVEADDALIPELTNTFSKEIGEGRFTLIHADVRSFDPKSLGVTYRLVANIPYYITGEIIRQFLTAEAKPVSMTLLVQKEVAERIVRSKKESILALSVKAYGVPRYEFTVPRGAFVPAPSVDSAVLTVADIASPFTSEEDESWFFTVLRAGFAHKRKLLRGNLEAVALKEGIVPALTESDIPLSARPEDVHLDAWIALASKLQPQ